MKFKVKLGKSVISENGEKVSSGAFILTIDEEKFYLIPRQEDRRIISYLLRKQDKNNFGEEFDCSITRQEFVDSKTNQSVPYTSFAVLIGDEEFNLSPKSDDKKFLNVLLKNEGAFDDEKK